MMDLQYSATAALIVLKQVQLGSTQFILQLYEVTRWRMHSPINFQLAYSKNEEEANYEKSMNSCLFGHDFVPVMR